MVDCELRVLASQVVGVEVSMGQVELLGGAQGRVKIRVPAGSDVDGTGRNEEIASCESPEL
nr:hypothetical protein [Pseudoclavibacter sp. 13-3]